MNGPASLFQYRAVTLAGIRHELDEHGHYCLTCGELADYLLEQGGEGSF